MARDDILEMENYVLALAYAPGKTGQPGEPIGGRTILQKILFHLKKATQESRENEEMPHFYGPFDEQAAVVAEQLETSGYLRISDHVIQLTPRGMEEAKQVWESELTPRERKAISELKAFFAELTVDEILAITYAKYPKSATDSIVKDELQKRGRVIATNLVRRGKVSMDLAAKIAGMSLRDFMKELSRQKIAVVESEASA